MDLAIAEQAGHARPAATLLRGDADALEAARALAPVLAAGAGARGGARAAP